MERTEKKEIRKIVPCFSAWLLLMAVPAICQAQETQTDSIEAMREKLRQDSLAWEKELAAVTIKGTRSQFRQKNGGIVARISGTSLEKEPTTTDVLAKLPGMLKDKDGKPQAFIGGTPEIYINDRKVQDYSIVENLPVSQIKEVKVIHHPGAEYGNNVGCVLLITTKKNLEGLAIVENSGVRIDSYVTNQHDIDLTYSKGKMTYYGKVGYANAQFWGKEEHITTHYFNRNKGISGGNDFSGGTSESSIYQSTSVLDYKHAYTDRFYWSAGADFALSQKQTIGVKYDGYNIHQPLPYSMTNTAKTDGHLEDNVLGNNKILQYDWQHHVNAFYIGSFGEKWKLSVFGDFVKLHTEKGQSVDEKSVKGQAVDEMSMNGQAVDEKSVKGLSAYNASEQAARNQFYLLPQSDGTVWGAKARLNYTINDKQSLMLGGEYNYVKSESRADYTPADKGTSTHSITKEDHTAAFAEYSLDMKPFSLTVGLRYEHVDSRLDYLPTASGVQQEPIHRTYDNLYPSLSLSHSAGRFSQTLSYRSSETRPTFEELNTGTIYVNRYMQQVGNAELEPSKRHELQYLLTYGDFFFQASYTYVMDYTTSVVLPNEENPQMCFITWTNTDHCWNWGSFVGYRHRWGWYEPQVQTGIQQGFIRAEVLGKTKSYHDPYYIFNLYNGFHLPKGWYLNLSYSYRSSGTYDFSKISSVSNFDFELYKGFFKDRLLVHLSVNDIFNTIRQKQDGTYGNVRFQMHKWADTRNVQLRLTYRFNQAKKQYRGENTAQDAVGRMGGK